MSYSPSPPGDTIQDIMGERGLSRFTLAHALKISDENMLKLLNGTFLIDSDMAFRLSEVLGSTPDFWENRERQYREKIAELRHHQKER